LKPYPRANISEGDGITLSPELYNRIIEDIERLDRMAVMPPLFMTSGGSGSTIGLNLSPAELVLVAIIGAETGGGKYQGSIFYGKKHGQYVQHFSVAASNKSDGNRRSGAAVQSQRCVG